MSEDKNNIWVVWVTADNRFKRKKVAEKPSKAEAIRLYNKLVRSPDFGDKYSSAGMTQKQAWDIGEVTEEANTTSAGGEYATPHAFSKSKKSNKHTKPKGYTYTEPSIYEYIFNKINEVSYNDFKNDSSASTRQKINQSIKEISRQLYEMDKSLTRVMKLKTEIGADQSIFFKSTMQKFSKINERLLKLSNKVREFSK